MRQRKSLLALLTLTCLLLLAACTNNKPQTLPPGAINQFDAKAYDALMTAQATLNSVKADVSKLPPAAKPILNKAIDSYNAAQAAWQAYHALKSPAPQDQATVEAAITQAVSDIATLVQSFLGGKP